MKKIASLLFTALLFSSCVAIKFPNEIRVHVDLPENVSEEQIDRLIDKIPPTVGQGKIKTRVEISTDAGTTVKEEKKEENYNKDN